ncbi:hypothetical protein D9M68_355640 [compost metagenome]
MADQLGHGVQVGRQVAEILLVRRAQVVQAGFAIGRGHETVLRAFAMAGEAVVAVAAISRQRLFLGRAEGLLRGGSEESGGIVSLDVAQSVLRVHVVIAGVEAAVMLDDRRLATTRGEQADRRWQLAPGGQCPFEVHHVDLADILAHPFVEDGDQEVAIALGLDCLRRDRCRLRQDTQAQLWRCGEVQAAALLGGGGLSLHHWIELDMPHSLSLEEAVDL